MGESSKVRGPVVPRAIGSGRAGCAWGAAFVVAASSLLVAAAPVSAQVTAGPEVTVAATGASQPAIARDGQGRGVVAWIASTGELWARRLTQEVPGVAFHVNSVSSGNLTSPKVAMDATGGFIVVWEDDTPTMRAPTFLRGQLFRGDGRRRGTELGLSPKSIGAYHPQVAMAGDGRFVVGYEQSTWDPAQVVRLAAFSAGGGRLGKPIVMAQNGQLTNLVGAVSASTNSLAIGWTEFTPCQSNPIDPVSAVATFSWSLAQMGDVERLANDNPCIDGPQVVALPGSSLGPLGIFVGRRYSIQRFSDLDGARVGPRTNVAELPGCTQSACERVVAVAGDSRGRFVFIWERFVNGHFELFAEQYGREGTLRAEEFDVSEAPSTSTEQPAAAFSSDGTLVVTWRREGEGIVMRRFQIP
jgi:hypothetical protein